MRRGWILSAALSLSSLLTLAAAQSPPAGSSAGYVGSEACKDCHEDIYKAYLASSHGRAEQDAGVLAEKQSCENCHGPGSLHVNAGGDKADPGFATIRRPDKMAAADVNALCQKCHDTGEQLYWDHGAHARKGLSCVQCHSMHSAKDHKAQLKTERVSDTCLGCHRSKKIGAFKSAHMPVREGGMECTSCHNPHGTASDKMLRAASTGELCESCHADKRGPMLWEHMPVRESCANCHDAHGSNVPSLLKARMPFLCQRCHSNTGHPGNSYDGTALGGDGLPTGTSGLVPPKGLRIMNKSCINCHSQIHGSNHPSGKFFTR
jgi:DmsE family decaheme c-type cytochrome